MSRQASFIDLGGDGGDHYRGAVLVAHIVLHDEHGANPPLLRTNHRAQVSIENVAPLDIQPSSLPTPYA